MRRWLLKKAARESPVEIVGREDCSPKRQVLLENSKKRTQRLKICSYRRDLLRSHRSFHPVHEVNTHPIAEFTEKNFSFITRFYNIQIRRLTVSGYLIIFMAFPCSEWPCGSRRRFESPFSALDAYSYEHLGQTPLRGVPFGLVIFINASKWSLQNNRTTTAAGCHRILFIAFD